MSAPLTQAAFSLALMAAPQEGQNPLALFLPYILIFFIFYFIWFRPTQRERRKQEERLKNLKKGDEVVTAGGIVGEVVHVREMAKDKDGQPVKSMEDRVTIRSGESRLVVERGRIARVVTPKPTEPNPA
jgi:preprotein translocase subunit YajC